MLNTKLKQLELAQPVAVIGGGVTGLSCFHLLQSAGIDCRVFDERDSVPTAFVNHADNVVLGAFSAEAFADFGTILLSPGVDTRRDCFAQHEDKLLTDIELFARLTDKPIIGVTGSNGKSTVVSLLHQATQQAGLNYLLCGNIGLPVLQALSDSHVGDNVVCDGYIVELSSYHLERSPSLKLAVGVWLNVSPDHLDRYDSYADYVATKAKIFACADAIVGNANDEQVAAYCQPYSDKTWFSVNRDHVVLDHVGNVGNVDYQLRDNHVVCGDAVCFSMREFSQIGQHYAENIMAVFAVTDKLGIDRDAVVRACKNFRPLPARCVKVAEKNGITFVNDSKGTNVGATVAAISGIEQPIVLIAGGQGKGQDFSPLASVAKGRVKTAVLFGEDAEKVAAALDAVTTCHVVENLTQATATAIEHASNGNVVLLSPACASFDMFDSYIQRGEAFESLVKEWIDE